MLLRNNVLFYDPLARYGNHLRQPNNTELSVLLMRKIRAIGFDKSKWDHSRDGKLTTYDWCFPEDKPKPAK